MNTFHNEMQALMNNTQLFTKRLHRFMDLINDNVDYVNECVKNMTTHFETLSHFQPPLQDVSSENVEEVDNRFWQEWVDWSNDGQRHKHD
jgi:hypothetical protein